MSVITSGSGPSSRMQPASTNGTSSLTHSYMMPLLSTPVLDGRADAAQPADRVDGPQVVLVAVLDRHAAVERDAQAGAVEGLLDVVRGQGVAGEEDVEIARRG